MRTEDMNKFSILISLLMLSVTTTFAGTPLSWAKRNITVELGVGINYAPNSLIFDQVQTGWSAFVEPHYNFSALPLSLGLHLQGDIFARKWKGSNIDYGGEGLGFPSARLLLTGDYHWLLSPKAALFVGVGAGNAICRSTEDIELIGTSTYVSSGNERPFAALIRGGVTLSQSFRIALSYTSGDAANSFFCLHTSYIF